MLSGLRWRLTSLFLVAGLAMVVAVSASSYLLVWNYLLGTVDRSLEQKMAIGFHSLKIPQPPPLQKTWEEYMASQPQATTFPENGSGEEEGSEPTEPEDYRELNKPDLATVFLVAADRKGRLLGLAGTNPNLPVDQQAASAALVEGLDWRIIQIQDGTRIRLLTYQLDSEGTTLQAGRSLAEEDQLMQKLLWGLLALGGASVVVLGLASWWLAGRSLNPARQAWERQQAFVANASHELRAPLTLLRASVEVAQRRLPPEYIEPRRLLEDVLRECDAMDRLVGDLLLLSRLDSQRLPLELQPLLLSEVIGELERRVRPLAEEKGIILEVSSKEGKVAADAARLQQVLLILLDNAFHYTPAGKTVRVEGRVESRVVKITVIDSGEGIPTEDLPRVFERFYRVGHDHGRDSGGTGLGLAIAKSLVEAQRGQILIQSQAGRGTSVTITLNSV